MATSRRLAARGDRLIAKANLIRQERELARVAHQAITQYLRLVRRAMAHTRITAAAPLPGDEEPDDLDLGPDVDLNALDQSALWPEILQKTILPGISTLLTGIGPKDMTPAVASSVNSWRAQWLDDQTQKLAGVPDQITKQIRDAVQANAEEHGPDPRAAARIVTDLMNPDAPTWKSRANTIARTEVVGANNQGGLASWTAVHESLAPVGGRGCGRWRRTDWRRRDDRSSTRGAGD